MGLWKRASGSPSVRGGISTFIDQAAEIEGTFRFRGMVLLNGRLQGEVDSTDTLIIGEQAVVNATIRAGTVIINGDVTGNVQASERVEVRGRGRLFGDIEAPVFVLEEGVVFEGHCRMRRPESAEPVPVPVPARESTIVSLKR